MHRPISNNLWHGPPPPAPYIIAAAEQTMRQYFLAAGAQPLREDAKDTNAYFCEITLHLSFEKKEIGRQTPSIESPRA